LGCIDWDVDARGRRDETRRMTIDAWWDQLSSETRNWLMANNGGPVPPAVVAQIERAGGPGSSDPWWAASDEDPSEVVLPDHAVDWVEEFANGESQATE
jgi:hypothetical protein